MKDQIRVLMVVPNLRVSNGVASFAMSYYRSLDHDKVKMDFVCYQKKASPYLQEIEAQGDHIFHMPPVKSIINHLKVCKRMVYRGNYDVIHVNSLMITYPLMLVAKRHIPVRILHSHNTKLGDTNKKECRNRVFVPLLIKSCNYYTACSSIAGKALFGNLPFDVIPNVIHPQTFRFNQGIRDRKRSEENCANKVIIGAVGRLAYQKNPYFAIDVVEKIVSERKDVDFWWIGSGGLDQDVNKYVEEKGLQNRIKLFGSRIDVDELYQAMDLFFLPSQFEGFGLACLEAETAGLPCVVSTEFPEEINVTGDVKRIDLEKDIDIWIDAIQAFLSTDKDRNAGFDIVNTSVYSDEVSGKRLTDYYSNLLKFSDEGMR